MKKPLLTAADNTEWPRDTCSVVLIRAWHYLYRASPLIIPRWQQYKRISVEVHAEQDRFTPFK